MKRRFPAIGKKVLLSVEHVAKPKPGEDKVRASEDRYRPLIE